MSHDPPAIVASRERQHVVNFDDQDAAAIARVGDFVTLIFEDEFGHEVLTQDCCITAVDWLQREYTATPVTTA